MKHLASFRAPTDPSAYALHTSSKNFYKQLWDLGLLGKIKITVWRLSYNYIPTSVNLQYKKLLQIGMYPLCGKEAESTSRALLRCPMVRDVWSYLRLELILVNDNIDFG